MKHLPTGYVNCFGEAFRKKGIPILITTGSIVAKVAGIVIAIYLALCVFPLWVSAILAAIVAFLCPVIKKTRENIEYERNMELNRLEREADALKWAHLNKRFDNNHIRRLRGALVNLRNAEARWGSFNPQLKRIKEEYKILENLYLN